MLELPSRNPEFFGSVANYGDRIVAVPNPGGIGADTAADIPECIGRVLRLLLFHHASQKPRPRLWTPSFHAADVPMSKVAFHVASARCDETRNVDESFKLIPRWLSIYDAAFGVVPVKTLKRREPPVAFYDRIAACLGLRFDNDEPLGLEEAVVEEGVPEFVQHSVLNQVLDHAKGIASDLFRQPRILGVKIKQVNRDALWLHADRFAPS